MLALLFKISAVVLYYSVPCRAEGLTAEHLLEKQLPLLRISRADLRIRADAWQTRLTIPSVEAMLEDPLQTPTVAEKWARTLRGVENAQSHNLRPASSEIVHWAAQALNISLDSSPQTTIAERPPPTHILRPVRRERDIPGSIRPTVEKLIQAIAEAQPLLDKAVHSISAEEKERALADVASIIQHENDRTLQSANFAAMEKLDRNSLFRAALILTQAADEAVSVLKQSAPALKSFSSRRWSVSSGDILLSGPGHNVYRAEDLKKIALLIDLGGNNHYEGPAAAGTDGKIRVIIDLGENVTVDGSTGGTAAGSGIFGIGLFYLPNPIGSKTFTAGDFSVGAGLFGVGGLFVEGSSASFHAHHFSEGAGALGLGILQVRGDDARYDARFAGQGFGFTGGAGIFLHHGNRAHMNGGIFYADSREDSAGMSLSQGVGYGLRAFAAGGVGVALVDGNHNTLESSYFAQGSGYWHGFGGLFVFGDENRLRARRYDQGSGVHTAVGTFLLKGNKNRMLNWGVGPAYGWDNGVGLWLADGDDNEAQADWATGHGAYGGHGFAVVRGDRNRLLLPEFGTGEISRAAPSYGLALCLGRDNRFRWHLPKQGGQGTLNFRVTPWGTFHAEGDWIFDSTIEPTRPEWPRFDRGRQFQRQMAVLTKRLQEAQVLSGTERLTAWLSAASSFGLGVSAEGQAAGKLLTLPKGDVLLLAELLSPDHFEEFVWLRALLAAYGRNGAAALLTQIPASTELKKALTIGSLNTFRSREVMPALTQAVEDSDWRVRRAAASAIGYLLDRQTGNEPGRMRLLKALASRFHQDFSPLLRNKRLADIYAVLALDPNFSEKDRIAVLDQSRNPYDPVPSQAIDEFIRIIKKHRRIYRREAREELSALKEVESQARKILIHLTRDSDSSVIQTAVVSLGAIGKSEDAPLVASFFNHEKGTLRETAAASLAKMGSSAREALEKALKSDSPNIRTAAILAIAQSTDSIILDLLHQGLSDPDVQVRGVAASAISRFQELNQGRRRDFLPDLRRLETSDPDPSVRVAAAYAASSITP